MTNFILLILFMLYLIFICTAVTTVCWIEIKRRIKIIKKWDDETETIKKK